MSPNPPFPPVDDVLRQQRDYYQARATEYDEWFLRQGRYDRGPDQRRQWEDDVAALRQALAEFRPRGRTLELACGTGWWTAELLQYVPQVEVVDAAPAMLAATQQRVGAERVTCTPADLFAWQPTGQYDTIFFSFWLSHVPAERWPGFWQTVAAGLAPSGRVFFIDSLRTADSTAVDQQLPAKDSPIARRRLNDGQEYAIYKIFYDPADLTRSLTTLGWEANISRTATFFLHGQARIAPA